MSLSIGGEVIELQTNAFQGQSLRKEKAQPNKSYQQGCYQQSGSDGFRPSTKEAQGLRESVRRKGFIRQAQEGLAATYFQGMLSSLVEYRSEDQPEYAYLGRFWVSPTLTTWRGRNLAAKIWSLSRRLSTTARGMCQNFSFKESLHLLRSSSRRH